MQACGATCVGTTRPGAAESQAGFSLVELVVVMVVIGLLAAVAAPRFLASSAFEERAYRDEVVAALRYARNLAIGSGCPVRVTLDATSYALSQQAVTAGHCDPADSSWPLPVVLTDGQVFGGSAPAGVTTAPLITIVFDAAGRTNLAGDLVITVGADSFTLRAGSGFVSS